MITSRMILRGIVVIVCVLSAPLQAKSFWDSPLGWFSKHVHRVQRATNEKLVKPVVDAVGSRIKKGMDPLIKQGVDAVEEHAKPALLRVVKQLANKAERHSRPIIARAEKRIYKNVGQTITKYCASGLGGIVAVCLLRQVATRMTHESSHGFGEWLQRQNAGSTFGADAVIGALIGLGLYGIHEAGK